MYVFIIYRILMIDE